ncbi:MAG: excinuclease ABC subunit UvrA, partial [Promethearchaeota archaeon]
MPAELIIKGASQHNLKNIDIRIPRNKLVVITGVSGSGKSSLAFDTIYAEGQRRYVESLSAYARQFLGQMQKPAVESIEGLSPAISIEQKTVSKNPRSTVGTITEIYDYLRLLFARVGIPHCYKCGRKIQQSSVQQIVDQILQLPPETRIRIRAPVVSGRKGTHAKTLATLLKEGYVRAIIDGEEIELVPKLSLEKNKKHNIEVIVDRLQIKSEVQGRLTDSLETAMTLSEGMVNIEDLSVKNVYLFSQHLACPYCGIGLQELAPRMFSFNSPFGACPKCNGLGKSQEIDEDLVIPDRSKTIRDGAICNKPLNNNGWRVRHYTAISNHYGFDLDTPIEDMKPNHVQILLYGSGKEKIHFSYFNEEEGTRFEGNWRVEGVVNRLARLHKQTKSDYTRAYYESFMSKKPCTACSGTRLKPESMAVTVGKKNIGQVTCFSVKEAIHFFHTLKLTDKEQFIAKDIQKEIINRLTFLMNVGLDYLTLDRMSSTLSGGESQRIRLATQIGSRLVGVLYILDEPSIGLHARDKHRLIKTLKELRDLGNTILVVEHDEDTIREADYVVDLGPGAGVQGGYLVVAGSPQEIETHSTSITALYLSGRKRITIPSSRRPLNGKYLTVVGAKENNLKSITVNIPLGVFTCITGVSGSGKSSFLNEILYKALANRLHRGTDKPGKHKDILGYDQIDKVIAIDQSPIGRTPRSNPATYTGLFDHIRDLFAEIKEAKIRGYKKGRFSFNVKGGRCEICRGGGQIKIEMHFLADVWIECEECKGKRYNRETLDIKYREKNISEVLNMTVDEALVLFKNIPKIKSKLETLHDVGLGYIHLGQSATTLSGGEAQRVKLAKELSRKATGKTVYILDEPTTGLHFADIEYLLDVLGRLTDAGNTVIVIEHNFDVIKQADYIIDLGPEGGERGGEIVAEGTPEEISRKPISYTGQFLRSVLEKENNSSPSRDSKVPVRDQSH